MDFAHVNVGLHRNLEGTARNLGVLKEHLDGVGWTGRQWSVGNLEGSVAHVLGIHRIITASFVTNADADVSWASLLAIDDEVRRLVSCDRFNARTVDTDISWVAWLSNVHLNRFEQKC